MTLSNYVGACQNLANELRDALTPEDLAQQHAALKGRKVIDWIRWRNEKADLVSEFVQATPKERQTKKKFQTERSYLVMAGVQHCLEAHALLRVVENSFLVPGGSYRSMAAIAGLAYNDLYDYDIPYWPFNVLESPFIDDMPPSAEA